MLGNPLQSDGKNGYKRNLKILLEQWYTWLGSNPAPLFHPSCKPGMYKPVAFYYENVQKLHQTAITGTERFLQEGARSLLNDMSARIGQKGDAAMTRSQNPEAVKQQLKQLLEHWYAWLSSNPEPTFSRSDNTHMKNPVIYFHEAIDWLSRTTMANTEWFFAEGSQIVMNRWIKGDYDAYE